MEKSTGADDEEDDHVKLLSEGVQRLYETHAHTDITINVEDKVFPCHRAILAAVSPYFDAMFSSGMRESVSGEVSFQEMDAEIFQNIIDYIYKGKVVVTEENATKLLRSAGLLQIKSLCEKCESVLEPHIDKENCIEVWRLCVFHNCQKLAEKALKLILQHFQDIAVTEDFLNLDVSELMTLLKDDDLYVPSEDIVCDIVIRWLKKDLKNRKPCLERIVGNIRLAHVSPEKLLYLVSKDSPMADDISVQRMVEEAKEYKLLSARVQDASSTICQYRNTSKLEEVLVVIGGCKSMIPPYKRCKDVLVYSFIQDKWFRIEPMPYDPGIEFAACSHGNNIYVTGGGSMMQTFLQYRSARNTWKICKTLCRGRRRHVVVATTNAVYVLGGYDHTLEEGNRMLPSIEMYDFLDDVWKTVGKLQTPVSSFSAAVCGQRIFTFGGETNDKSDTGVVQCFDTMTRACTNVSYLPIVSKLTKSVTIEKRIFVLFFSGKVVELRPDCTCKIVGTVRNFRRIHYGAIQYRGYVYIVGGENEDASLCNDTICYCVAGNTTDTTPKSLPYPRLIDSCVKIAIPKKFLNTEQKEGEVPCTDYSSDESDS